MNLSIPVRTLFLMTFLLLSSFSFSQVDDISYNQSAQRLTYLINYNRILENAEARECSREAFENSLLHTVTRTLFLYLPYEASFYEGVEILEVRAIDGDKLVLYATAPLQDIRDTNARFRTFMNSFGSSRAGFCFTVEGGVLESWVSTLTARGGRVAIDTEMLETRIEGLQDLAALEVPSLDSAAVVADVAPADVAPAEPAAPEATPEEAASPAQAEAPAPPEEAQAETPAAEAAPQEAAAPQAEAASPIGAGYNVVPYLSEERILSFDSSQQVLQPNTDYAALIETSKGTLTVDLFEDQAPVTVNNFVFLALNQYYEGVSLFRVLEDFVVQSGDPTGTGVGGPGYQVPNEIAPGFSHSTAGVLSMANAGPDTNGSQFFITLAPQTELDGNYSIFGAVTDGINVLDSIVRTDPNQPLSLASLDSTLGLLETQGISLEGNDEETLGNLLTRSFGTTPELAQRFSVGDYDLIIGSDGQSGTPTVAFWPKSDVIHHVYIVAKTR
ncbi:MAG: peptidylprolyl isomerase [Trueperaceae bacterium]